MVQLDRDDAQNWTLFGDLWIIMWTFVVVLIGVVLPTDRSLPIAVPMGANEYESGIDGAGDVTGSLMPPTRQCRPRCLLLKRVPVGV